MNEPPDKSPEPGSNRMPMLAKILLFLVAGIGLTILLAFGTCVLMAITR